MSYRVVIIDDEPWTRDVLHNLGQWNQLGLKLVGEASDGESGLALVQKLRPDIVVTDIKMPLMDGIELVEALRKTDDRTRVIVVSGYDDFTYVHSAMLLDATDYLLKPIKAAELNRQLRKCIEQLDRMQSVDEEQDVAGFMDAPWMKRYMPLRASLQAQLISGDPEALADIFRQIGSLTAAAPTRALLIALYYDLMGILERHIVAAGYLTGEVLSGEGLVFGSDTTHEQVLLHVQAQYKKALQKLAELIQAQKGLSIAQVENYVQAHATLGITLTQAAHQFFITPEYLSKAFKQYAGVSFTEFITGIRMQKAKEMLESGVALKDLHAALGYSEQATFYKAFKRFFGITPGEMKKKIKNRQ